MTDLEFARKVTEGDTEACRRFVEDHSALILSKVWQLMKTHCRRLSSERVCCLLVLQRGLKGQDPGERAGQCDECIDSYIWFFESLKKKLKSYRGDNRCSLRTYVWSIVNSRNTFLDWLRWRYGRIY